MAADGSGWFEARAKRAAAPQPRAADLGLKLSLAVTLAASLALGSPHPGATFSALLEGFAAALAGMSLMLAAHHREAVWPMRFGYWQDAALFAALAAVSHFWLFKLR